MVHNKAQFDDRIRNLLALAEDNSVESRTLLFSHICDLFIQDRPMESDNQVRMLVEILNELVSDIDINIRAELRNILLSVENPPEELIKLVSEDVIEVSGKLLEEAMIEEEQLLYLIKYASDDHREHIGRRFGLSPILRREIDKARKEKQEVEDLVAKAENKKISLQELEEAEQNSTELNEDVTASILETLRSSKDKLSAPPQDEVTEDAEIDDVEQEPSLTASKDNISLIAKITELSQPLEDDENDDHLVKIPQEVLEAAEETIFTADAKEDIDEALNDIEATLTKELQGANDTEPDDDDEVEEELILDHEAPQSGPTSMTEEWFWEIDRYGNVKYLSENAEAVFLQPLDSLAGEDFLCLWRRKGALDSDPNDFIALFEKRQPFRDEEFLFEISPNVFQNFSLSAIATFDIDSGRFTGFRGSAHLNSPTIESVDPEFQQEEDDEAVDPVSEEITAEDEVLDLTDQEVISSDEQSDAFENHRPQFSGNLIDKDEEAEELTNKNTSSNDQQDEVASELLHNLSHEFRTPLNAIIGFSQMIDNEMWGPVSDKYRKNTKDIINAANHLKEAVNNILDSAKMEAGLIEPSPESFSLKSIIQDAMKALAPILESKEIRVTGIDDNIDVILYNDKHCIILCLIKIISFATKQAELGDELHLSVLVNSNAQVRIEIPIINQHIEESKADELFQKTYTLHSSNDDQRSDTSGYDTKIASGFGLAVAQSIAELIGGELSVMSDDEKVTHIVFTISTYPID